jgi:hypothetical protein
MWYRVFAASAADPDPDALLALLNRFATAEGRFRADAAGWFHADFVCDDIELSLDRYTADEEGVRAELNTWAAFVESLPGGAEHAALMQRLIQTRQLFALDGPATARGRLLCVVLCDHLARTADGVYQIDGKGFFDRDGTLLLLEE